MLVWLAHGSPGGGGAENESLWPPTRQWSTRTLAAVHQGTVDLGQHERGRRLAHSHPYTGQQPAAQPSAKHFLYVSPVSVSPATSNEKEYRYTATMFLMTRYPH